MSVLIKGGRIVTAADEQVADVYAEGERIALIGESLEVEADRVVDATGKYVIPGAIDPHTHIEMPFGGLTTVDDFTSGTVAAAFGGTTTVIDFCLQVPGEPFAQSIETWHEKIERCKPVVDVGFHIAITDLKDGGRLKDLPAVVEGGVTSFKLFMAYPGVVMVDDETLFKTMNTARETGALVMVHAESGYAIDVLVREAVAEGRLEPKWHAATRPPLTEAEATSRAAYLAELAQAPLYVVHVSCREAVEPIAAARARGWRVWGETCTQYLFIDETYLERPDFEGAKYVFTPPPRPKEQQEHLWHALSVDDLSVVSTDHAPFHWKTQKTRGRDDFTKIPNGAPGIEDRLLMLHHFGVREGRISMQRLVELTSTNVAKLFGLYPRKGTIAVGSDADLVVWDPEKARTLSAETHHSNIDYNAFEGTSVVGAPALVLVRGQVIVDGDELVGQPGAGRFVKRDTFQHDAISLARPPAVTAA
jgi:dihydropyrimidinase